jgi:chromosome segregation ATPase
MTPLDADVARELDRLERHLASVQTQAAQVGGVEIELRALATKLEELKANMGIEFERAHARISDLRREFQAEAKARASGEKERLEEENDRLEHEARERKRGLWQFASVAIAAVVAASTIVGLIVNAGGP